MRVCLPASTWSAAKSVNVTGSQRCRRRQPPCWNVRAIDHELHGVVGFRLRIQRIREGEDKVPVLGTCGFRASQQQVVRPSRAGWRGEIGGDEGEQFGGGGGHRPAERACRSVMRGFGTYGAERAARRGVSSIHDVLLEYKSRCDGASWRVATIHGRYAHRSATCRTKLRQAGPSINSASVVGGPGMAMCRRHLHPSFT